MDNNTEMTTSKKYEIMRGEIFDYIKKIGFTPINAQYGNGYFIFDMGENSVVNFWIKELKGWKFGIWFYSPKDDNGNILLTLNNFVFSLFWQSWYNNTKSLSYDFKISFDIVLPTPSIPIAC